MRLLRRGEQFVDAGLGVGERAVDVLVAAHGGAASSPRCPGSANWRLHGRRQRPCRSGERQRGLSRMRKGLELRRCRRSTCGRQVAGARPLEIVVAEEFQERIGRLALGVAEIGLQRSPSCGRRPRRVGCRGRVAGRARPRSRCAGAAVLLGLPGRRSSTSQVPLMKTPPSPLRKAATRRGIVQVLGRCNPCRRCVFIQRRRVLGLRRGKIHLRWIGEELGILLDRAACRRCACRRPSRWPASGRNRACRSFP